MNNEKWIGTIKVDPYTFQIYDEGILFKAYNENLNVSLYERHLKDLEEKCIDYIASYFDEEPM